MFLNGRETQDRKKNKNIGGRNPNLEGEIQAHEVFPETCVIQAQMQRVTRNYCD